jgi:hypothetical protein
MDYEKGMRRLGVWRVLRESGEGAWDGFGMELGHEGDSNVCYTSPVQKPFSHMEKRLLGQCYNDLSWLIGAFGPWRADDFRPQHRLLER